MTEKNHEQKKPFFKKRAERNHLKRIKELEQRALSMQKDYAKEVVANQNAIRSIKTKLAKIYYVRGDSNNYDKYQW